MSTLTIVLLILGGMLLVAVYVVAKKARGSG